MLSTTAGEVIWLAAITVTFVGVIVGGFVIVRNLFRAARHRNTPGWWAAAWIATALMFFPVVGIAVGLVVLQIERSTRAPVEHGRADTYSPS